eukprot:SM000039S14558  [mRNA]  locus=s39:744400:746735:- [translate_table: standard]
MLLCEEQPAFSSGSNGGLQPAAIKQLPAAYHSPKMRELADCITRDILAGSPAVRWDSIKGLEAAKQLLQEAVVMPTKYPRYFQGLLSPWKGILLFGPPGTGKTMLAKAVASECRTTFFNISASSIVSKWRGELSSCPALAARRDSEKLVRALFELARHHAPSTIFLDELDALASHRGGGPAGEHEASRRLKTELLVQMDGLNQSTDLVFVLAASNLPWELDAAMLRRLEKRILVPLPSPEARLAILTDLLPPGLWVAADDGLPYEELVTRTAGFSGSDLRLVCKEAAMAPLRRLIAALESGPEGVGPQPEPGPLTAEDAQRALAATRSSVSAELTDKYAKFDCDYGSQVVL